MYAAGFLRALTELASPAPHLCPLCNNLSESDLTGTHVPACGLVGGGCCCWPPLRARGLGSSSDALVEKAVPGRVALVVKQAQALEPALSIVLHALEPGGGEEWGEQKAVRA